VIIDSRCNVKCISDTLVKVLIQAIHLNKTVKFKTSNNNIKCLGHVTCEMTIGDKTLKIQPNLLLSLNYSFIHGLDLIKMFNLEISSPLQVFQYIHLNSLMCRKEININLDHNAYINFANTLSLPITIIHFAKINKLIQNFQAIFALNKYDIGLISSCKCTIELKF